MTNNKGCDCFKHRMKTIYTHGYNSIPKYFCGRCKRHISRLEITRNKRGRR